MPYGPTRFIHYVWQMDCEIAGRRKECPFLFFILIKAHLDSAQEIKPINKLGPVRVILLC